MAVRENSVEVMVIALASSKRKNMRLFRPLLRAVQYGSKHFICYQNIQNVLDVTLLRELIRKMFLFRREQFCTSRSKFALNN